MVDQFMEQLGIVRAPLVGHSMGGTVSLQVAMQYPQRVSRVVVIGSPIQGSSLALLLKLAGRRQIAFLVYNNMWALKLGIRVAAPMITVDRRWPEMMDRDLSRTTLESFLLSIATLHKTDLTGSLEKIQVPVMGIYGQRDNIVNPNQWKPLCEHLNQARIENFADAGHFVMLDNPKRFMETLREFLNGEPNHRNQP
jgi:pimeloyl-ACP methyl ester carboxylesterase